MDMKRFIESWFFAETVEGISDIGSFFECDSELHDRAITFEEWLGEQELEQNFKDWLKQYNLIDAYRSAKCEFC